MLLINSLGKYDKVWVIGNINIDVVPELIIEQQEKDGNIIIHRKDDLGVVYLDKFESVVFSILNTCIEQGNECLSSDELAIKYCMNIGLFDETTRQAEVENYCRKVKAMNEENTSEREYYELIAINGGSLDVLGEDIMRLINTRVNLNLIYDYLVPQYIRDEDKRNSYIEFYRNLREAVTHFIRINIIKEIISE